MKKILLLTATLLAALASCTKSGDNSGNKDQAAIKIDRTAFKIMKEGGDMEIEFNSTADWVAATDAEWVLVGEENGPAGDNVLPLFIETFESDNESDTRIANIEIKTKSGDASVKITVTQYAAGAISPSSLEFPKEGGKQEFSVYSPDEEPHVEWLGENDGMNPDAVPDWAEIVFPEGPVDDIYTYTIVVKENTTGEDRMAQVQPCFSGTCNFVNILQKGK